MGGPCRSRDQVAIDAGLIHRQIHVRATGGSDVGRDRGVATATASVENAGGGQELSRVADRGNRFMGFGKVANDLEHARVQAQVFGRAASRDHQRVIRSGITSAS